MSKPPLRLAFAPGARSSAGASFHLACFLLLLMLTASTEVAKAQSFSTPTSYVVGGNPDYVTSGDLNGDGKPDLAAANAQSDNVSVLLNNGNGTFVAAVN